MPKLIGRFFALSILCVTGAFGQQGTFGQIAFGGSWQTTFTLMNMSSANPADVTLSFFGDDGSPLNAPVQGAGNVSTYMFTLPPSGAQNVVLSTSDSQTVQGWASMSASGATVRGQGSFRFLLQNGTISEAVVPLSIPGTPGCIFPIPPPPDPVILVPFDNTAGYVTSIALANTKSSDLSIAIEFDDQSNHQVVTDTLTLPAMQHTAFVSTQKYQALPGTKGILRIHASTAQLTVLGLLSNPTGAVTTIIPVTQ